MSAAPFPRNGYKARKGKEPCFQCCIERRDHRQWLYFSFDKGWCLKVMCYQFSIPVWQGAHHWTMPKLIHRHSWIPSMRKVGCSVTDIPLFLNSTGPRQWRGLLFWQLRWWWVDRANFKIRLEQSRIGQSCENGFLAWPLVQ